MSLSSLSQVQDSYVVTLTANLNSSLVLSMDDSNINFQFKSQAEYEKGVGNQQKDFCSRGKVVGTTNWRLSCRALNELKHEDGRSTLPLNNVGVSARKSSSKDFRNFTENAPAALSKKRVELLAYSGIPVNTSSLEENSFELIWEMGTRQGNMNTLSIKDQNLKKGKYSARIAMVVTELIK